MDAIEIQLTARISLAIGVVVVTWLSLTPGEALPDIDIWDKLLHVSAFAAIGLAGSLAFQGWRFGLVVAAGLLALGCILELAQIIIPGRSASIADALANGVGVAFGLVAAWTANLLLCRYERSSL